MYTYVSQYIINSVQNQDFKEDDRKFGQACIAYSIFITKTP